jgi:uncharacterized membrane protein YeaQ/YmgE (transglycosylase-associated protein family)
MMSIVLFIILGGIVGLIAIRLMHRHEGIMSSVIIGIIGSFIGSFIARIFDSSSSYTSLTWSGFLWSIIGAVVLVGIINAFSRSGRHTMQHH